jgi:hypothetical protein
VVELVDARDSKSRAARRAGSIPAPGTTFKAASFQRLLDTVRLFSFSTLENAAKVALQFVDLASQLQRTSVRAFIGFLAARLAVG